MERTENRENGHFSGKFSFTHAFAARFARWESRSERIFEAGPARGGAKLPAKLDYAVGLVGVDENYSDGNTTSRRASIFSA